MQINLTPTWALTTEHAQSHYRLPVLIDRGNDTSVYGPADIVQLYPSWPLQPAAMSVLRAYHTKKPCPFSNDETEVIRSFLSQWPNGPQLP